MTAPTTTTSATVGCRDNDILYMLNQLKPEELELAAQASYEYGHSSSSPSKFGQDTDEPSQRTYFASAMAQRYLESKADKDKALDFMKSTLQFRKDLDIDGLVRCSRSSGNSDTYQGLRRFLSTKQSFVQGYDKSGRSTYIFIPRLVQGHDPEWTLKGHVWSLERAIACSRARDKTVNFAVDFAGFDVLSHAPPLAIGKEIMLTLRNHYVGHVNRIFLVNAPTAFVCLWAVMKHFAGSKTRSKIQFVNSESERTAIIGDFYTQEEATHWMLPFGKKNRELDVDEYLDDTPFDRAFDECHKFAAT
jgi:CRAL/TRIO domain